MRAIAVSRAAAAGERRHRARRRAGRLCGRRPGRPRALAWLLGGDRLPLCRRRRPERRLRPRHRSQRAARAADPERPGHGGSRRRRSAPACSRRASRLPLAQPTAARVVALATAACILLYDAWGKRRRWSGPSTWGCAAALNLLLGVAAVPGGARLGLAAGAAAARLHHRGDGGQPGRGPRRKTGGRGVRSDILDCRPGGAARRWPRWPRSCGRAGADGGAGAGACCRRSGPRLADPGAGPDPPRGQDRRAVAGAARRGPRRVVSAGRSTALMILATGVLAGIARAAFRRHLMTWTSSGREFASTSSTRSSSPPACSAPSNLLLRDVVARSADETPVAAARRGRSRRRSITHPALLEPDRSVLRAAIEPSCSLAGPVVVVPGGEAVKNDPRHVDAIHRGDPRRRPLPPLVCRRRSAAARCSTSPATRRPRRTAASG